MNMILLTATISFLSRTFPSMKHILRDPRRGFRTVLWFISSFSNWSLWTDNNLNWTVRKAKLTLGRMSFPILMFKSFKSSLESDGTIPGGNGAILLPSIAAVALAVDLAVQKRWGWRVQTRQPRPFTVRVVATTRLKIRSHVFVLGFVQEAGHSLWPCSTSLY